MAIRPVVLCNVNVLCFAVNKYGKTAVKVLKSSLTDFYTVEVLVDAKKRLAEDIDQLNLPAKRPHVPSRREGDGRVEREVSDIVLLLTFADEQKVLDNLPTYVCDNPDDMPSLRLYDGELNVIMRKLNETAAEIPQPVPGDSESNTDWATVASTPLNRRNRFAVLSTVTEDNTDGDQFTLVQSRQACQTTIIISVAFVITAATSTAAAATVA